MPFGSGLSYCRAEPRQAGSRPLRASIPIAGAPAPCRVLCLLGCAATAGPARAWAHLSGSPGSRGCGLVPARPFGNSASKPPVRYKLSGKAPPLGATPHWGVSRVRSSSLESHRHGRQAPVHRFVWSDNGRLVDPCNRRCRSLPFSQDRRPMPATLEEFDRKAWIRRFGAALERTATGRASHGGSVRHLRGRTERRLPEGNAPPLLGHGNSRQHGRLRRKAVRRIPSLAWTPCRTACWTGLREHPAIAQAWSAGSRDGFHLGGVFGRGTDDVKFLISLFRQAVGEGWRRVRRDAAPPVPHRRE